MKKRLFALLLALLLLWTAPACADQAWIDGELTQTAGQGGEWYIIALSQSGSYDFSGYRAALLDYLASTKVSSATTRQKYALTLLAAGSTDDYVAAVMEDSIGRQGVMSWVYGLHLMNNGCTSSAIAADEVVHQLLELQLEDGGWAVTGAVSDADVTAMVLQALAPHQAKAPVAAAIDAALTLLSSKQLADGDFASYGVPCAESTAQVLTALACLGIDAPQDERFIKNGHTVLDGLNKYALADGSYSHALGGASSTPATTQAYFAKAAYQRLLDGKGSIYLLDPAAPANPPLSWQAIASIVIAAIALLACLLLLLMKKRSRKNYAAVFVAAILLISGIHGIDIQSAEDYYAAPSVTKAAPIGTVTLSIRCDAVAGQADHIPADGVILPETRFTITQGDTTASILTEAARAHGLRMDVSGGGYVAGINYLYEFDFGELSGWMYAVNGAKASVGNDQYILQDGDVITWHYTCEMGNDLP